MKTHHTVMAVIFLGILMAGGPGCVVGEVYGTYEYCPAPLPTPCPPFWELELYSHYPPIYPSVSFGVHF